MQGRNLPNPSRTVFLNCPYRPDYQQLFEAPVFAIHALGYVAEAALGSPVSHRSAKLCEVIKRSGWSVHDLSRMTEPVEGLPRLNVPFELGLVMGIHGFCRKGSKPCLIFDESPHRYLSVLSDLHGFDGVRGHANNPENVIRELRGWIRRTSGETLPSAEQLLEQWTSYQQDRPEVMRLLGSRPTHEFDEFRNMVSVWLDRKLSCL